MFGVGKQLVEGGVFGFEFFFVFYTPLIGAVTEGPIQHFSEGTKEKFCR